MFKIIITSTFLICLQLFSMIGITETAFSEDSIENQIIVRFAKGVSESDARAIAAKHDMRVIDVIDSPTSKYGQCILILGSTRSTGEMINTLEELEEVDSCAPNFINQSKLDTGRDLGGQWPVQIAAA